MAGDIARWTWHKGRFEEIFRERKDRRFGKRWPDGKSLAVWLSFDMQTDVDAAAGRSSHQYAFWDSGAVNYCDATMRMHDAREGLAWVLRILDKYRSPPTFMFCGLTVEWCPEPPSEVIGAGHEIGIHGHHHVKLWNLIADEELEEVTLATNAVREVGSDRPLGWRSSLYSVTDRAPDLLRGLADARHSDVHDQNFPYVLTKDERVTVQIPSAMTTGRTISCTRGHGHRSWTGTRTAPPTECSAR